MLPSAHININICTKCYIFAYKMYVIKEKNLLCFIFNFPICSLFICLGYSDFTGGFEDDGCWKRGVFTAVGGAPALSGANDGAVLERLDCTLLLGS